jgi:hypothetical protein
MKSRRERVFAGLFCVAWLGILVLALQVGAKAYDTNPEHLLGILVAVYLASWGPFFLLSRQEPVGKAARFAACTASTLAVVVALEVPAIFHLVDYRSLFSTPTPTWRRPGNLPDPELIYVRKGHQHTRLRFRGADLYRLRGPSAGQTYQCDLRLDGHGFRNPTDLTSADVIVLGDSFIEGLQVAAPELISARLAERLGQKVANLGRTGYGPQQELQVLRRFGLGLHPRTCIWAFYEGNDLQDANAYEADRKNVRRVGHEAPSRALYGGSLTRNCLSFVIRNWLRPESGWPARLHTGRFVDRSGQGIEMYFSCGVHEGNDLPANPRGDSGELKRVQSILTEAYALCARHGIDLVVLFVPAKFRVYRDLCSFDPDSPCLAWGVDDLPGALKAAVGAVSSEIGFLDLTSPFLNEAADGPLLYLPDDTHWSAEGHRRAAAALADLLAERRDSGRSYRGRPPDPRLTTRE